MAAWLELWAAWGLRLVLLLVAAVLAGGVVALGLRWRGSIWRIDTAARRRRRWEAWLGAILLAALAGALVGWVLPWLGVVDPPPGAWRVTAPLAVALAVFLGGWWQVRCLATRITLGEALLDESGVAPPALPPDVPPAQGRRIVILCDGTGNRPPDPADPAASNIWKIRQALVEDETQTVWYDPGVGTGTSRPARALAAFERWSGRIGVPGVSWIGSLGGRLSVAFEGMTGTGIGENILDGYREVVRQYRPGDRIYILGFSRGAYTARCIAGVIARCGMLKAGNLRYAPAVVDLYRARRGLSERVPIRPDFLHLLDDPAHPGSAEHRHPHVPIEMLGVFDTVASLGAPLWGWWFTLRGFRNLSLSTNPVPNCRHVYHALAMDERRATFFPTLFWRPPKGARGWNETLLQLWFRGAHADIGGGYPETGISDITLGWMLGHARDRALSVKDEALAALRPDPLARLHDETTRQPFWQVMGTWPRWARLDAGPPSDASGIAVHESVFARAATVAAAAGRCELLDLAPGARMDFVTEAHRQWDRTGLVVRGRGSPDAWYRLTYRGGRWRDRDGPPCGPDGEAEVETWRNLRWWFRGRRRLPRVRWMTLCATVAGPRRWKLRELPLRLALRYLFRRGPWLLLSEVAPLGENLAAPGATLLLRSDRADGMLHLFANDLWQTARNNSGALDLSIERLAGDPGGAEPLWHLPGRGGWSRYEGGARPG